MSKYFMSTDILIPKNCKMERWAVIACDQFTSDMAYWHRVRKTVGNAPSTLHMILPEAELSSATDQTVADVNAYMIKCLNSDIFAEYPQSFVYIERTLLNGSVRQGVIGAVDLEAYHYDPKLHPNICATEMTVLERIPPRVAVRKDAQVEFSHVLMLCDDPQKVLVESVAAKKDNLQKLYEFDLMENGGHIAGWLVQGEDARELETALTLYEQQYPYMVGDGNHSLVTAKTCYEQLKKTLPESECRNHPARYALVELENVHSDSMVFEPIHRIVANTDPHQLLEALQAQCSENGTPVRWFIGEQEGVLTLNVPAGELTVGVLQDHIDAWLKENPGETDYIHGDDAVKELATQENTIGFLLPGMEKSMLFPFVQSGRTLPRKTFSMGHGCEKRYYLEGRKIK